MNKTREKVIEAIGWTYAYCCILADKGKDIRKVEVPKILEQAEKDLKIK